MGRKERRRHRRRVMLERRRPPSTDGPSVPAAPAAGWPARALRFGAAVVVRLPTLVRLLELLVALLTALLAMRHTPPCDPPPSSAEPRR